MTFSTAYIISFDWNTLVNEFGKAEINILSLEKLRLREVLITEFCSTTWRLWPHLVSYFL